MSSSVESALQAPGTFPVMPKRPPLPPGVITRVQAAAMLGIGVNKVSVLRSNGTLSRPTPRLDGLCWLDEIEPLAAAKAKRRRAREEAGQRLKQKPTRPLPVLPPEQDATFEELTAAAVWTRDQPGQFVDTDGAAEILGVTPQYVGRLAQQGRLPWLPTGRLGGRPTRVYRRAQLEVIARARAASVARRSE